MNTHYRSPDADRPTGSMHRAADSRGLRIDKERWLQHYAVRILNRYMPWETPLGVASTYAARLREDLVTFYDDPLKRMFIEASY